ncbi:hypothetical protein GR268_48490 [Rhizobium leguminosarum]|nr:hypothetical protein [Rhizobium leguminosarum]
MAVFALGPPWQFKDWKWSSTVELYSKSTYRCIRQGDLTDMSVVCAHHSPGVLPPL